MTEVVKLLASLAVSGEDAAYDQVVSVCAKSLADAFTKELTEASFVNSKELTNAIQQVFNKYEPK